MGISVASTTFRTHETFWYTCFSVIMSRRAYVFLATLLILLEPVALSPLTSQNAAPVVDLGYSKYQGLSLSSGVDQYLGLRFATPPLGHLRFRAPVLPPVTSGLQNATKVRQLMRIQFILISVSFNQYASAQAQTGARVRQKTVYL